MSKKVALALVFLSIALLFGLFFWLKGPPDPTYRGKHLSEWLDDLERFRPPAHLPAGIPESTSVTLMKQKFQSADEAVNQIGEAAVPHLLNLLEKRDSKLKLWFVKLARKQSAIRITFRSESEWQNRAVDGFSALGPKGRSAVPRLINIIDDSARDGGSAALALGSIGREAKDAVPALTRALKRKDRSCRVWAAHTLAAVGKDSQSALTALIQALDDPDPVVRSNLVIAIFRIGGDPGLVVPALVKCIDDPAPDVRQNAAGWMETFGTNALIAVPRMQKLTNDSDPIMRYHAERFLQIVKFPAPAQTAMP